MRFLLLLLPLFAFADSVELTAEGGGKYVLTCGDTVISQHVAEREAAQELFNRLLEGRTDCAYTHAYKVTGSLSVDAAVEPEPEPEPEIPPIASYDGDYCQPVHDDSAAKVVLQDNERLMSAWERLETLSPGVGGVIEIPFGTELLECDVLNLTSGKAEKTPKLSVIGTGGRPVFYCRSDEFTGGTVAKTDVKGALFTVPAGMVFYVENIEKDGYKRGIEARNIGKVIAKNVYFHHGKLDGINSTNSLGQADYPDPGNALLSEKRDMTTEICGSQIAFHGQGNARHGTYMHRALGGGKGRPEFAELQLQSESWHKVVVVDSEFWDCNWSSCFKSIANENVLLNNKFWQHRDIENTDYSSTSQMLVDVSAAAINYFEGNEFYGFKPDSRTGAAHLVAFRNRRAAVRGADMPMMYTPYDIPPVKVDHPAHTEEYWTDLNGKIYFPSTLKNNHFACAGDYCDKQIAIWARGTYPVYQTSIGSPTCYADTPMAWYERSAVFHSGNTFSNYLMQMVAETPEHNYKNNCPTGDLFNGPGPSLTIFKEL